VDLRCDVADGVAVLTLHRPEVRNAISSGLRRELTENIDRLGADDDVAAIVLTGTDPAFSAGVDLRELRADPEVARTVGPRTAPVLSAVKPLIAAVNGPAYTGGLELVLACHFVVASERATFADTHAKLGLLPGWGMSVLLAEAVGVRRARQISVTGRPIDAATALQWGLVNDVVPHDHLLEAARTIGTQVAANDGDAVRATIGLYDRQQAVRDAPAWQLEALTWRRPETGATTGDASAKGR
jgi:enoyl-CoA hydratase